MHYYMVSWPTFPVPNWSLSKSMHIYYPRHKHLISHFSVWQTGSNNIILKAVVKKTSKICIDILSLSKWESGGQTIVSSMVAEGEGDLPAYPDWSERWHYILLWQM